MALNTELLSILVCPESKQGLTLGNALELERLNQHIRAGKVLDRSGQMVVGPLEAVLLRADRQICYPVRDDIPILLSDQAILTSGLI